MMGGGGVLTHVNGSIDRICMHDACGATASGTSQRNQYTPLARAPPPPCRCGRRQRSAPVANPPGKSGRLPIAAVRVVVGVVRRVGYGWLRVEENGMNGVDYTWCYLVLDLALQMFWCQQLPGIAGVNDLEEAQLLQLHHDLNAVAVLVN